MLRNFCLAFVLSVVTVFNVNATVKITRIDPAFWYAGMKQTTLQLMVYGPDIRSADVKVDDPVIKIDSIVRLESHNYLLIYLNVPATASPGNVKLVFTQNGSKTTMLYELKTRTCKPEDRIGFSSSDVLYLLMPDRFANGKPNNDQLKWMSPYKVDRHDPSARHGGDLAGIEKHLDYFTDLGVTALWFTPILENNMKGGSYHGYAITDYYNVDPRFGSNEEYVQLIKAAHQKGLKVVMDMVFNHCGSEHIWIKDMPSKDWFNHSDYKNHYVQTSYRLTPVLDPYASDKDMDEAVNGWFVPTMPDLNQKNPHVMRYLIQNSKFWIEYAGINGIRMDTYPYADYNAMSEWTREIQDEYPNFNIVGETWCTQSAYTAAWQKDSRLLVNRNSGLKTVMDFSFWDQINKAKHEETDADNGLGHIYSNFVYDYLYTDVSHIMAFFENHDTDRFIGDSNDTDMLKQAYVLLLTIPRIPQIYYGSEVLLGGVKKVTDGNVRKDFPGGWDGDAVNAFTGAGMTAAQTDMHNFVRKILHWRKGNEVISRGTMKHFIPYKGIYVYQRELNGKRVIVILNGTTKTNEFNPSDFSELFVQSHIGKDILSDKSINFSDKFIMAPRQSMIMEMQ
jgi:neopullulanase